MSLSTATCLSWQKRRKVVYLQFCLDFVAIRILRHAHSVALDEYSTDGPFLAVERQPHGDVAAGTVFNSDFSKKQSRAILHTATSFRFIHHQI